MCDLLLPAQVSPTLCAPAARGEFGLPCGQPRSLTKYRCSCTNPSTAHGHLRGRKWGRGSTPQSWVRVNEWIKHLEQDLAHDKHETDVPCLWVLQGLSVVTELFLLLVRVFKTGPRFSPHAALKNTERKKKTTDWSIGRCPRQLPSSAGHRAVEGPRGPGGGGEASSADVSPRRGPAGVLRACRAAGLSGEEPCGAGLGARDNPSGRPVATIGSIFRFLSRLSGRR